MSDQPTNNLTLISSISPTSLGKLKARLDPANHAVVTDVLAVLLKGMFRIPANSTNENALKEYVGALEGLPVGAIREVTRKLKNGEYPKISETGFLPIPSYFAALVQEERMKIVEVIASARRADKRRLAIWNGLPDHMNNREKEERIDAIIAGMDAP